LLKKKQDWEQSSIPWFHWAVLRPLQFRCHSLDFVGKVSDERVRVRTTSQAECKYILC
jgi:hypothetical protein